MKFFLDQCVPRSVGQNLLQHGHEVIHPKEHLAPDAPDPDVIAKAQQLDAILVSLNGDFGDIVAFPPALFSGIVALQVKNHPEALGAILATLNAHLAAHMNQASYHGKLLLVEPHRIRIRR